MSQENYTEEEDFTTEDSAGETQGSSESQPDRKWVRDLEKRAKGAEQAKAEANAAKRELAFIKVGIDLDSPQGKLFAKAYDGDYSVEAVRAAAMEYGMIQPPEPEIPDAEFQTFERMSRAGSSVAEASYADPIAKINQAETPEEIIAILKQAGVQIDNEQPGQWKSLV